MELNDNLHDAEEVLSSDRRGTQASDYTEDDLGGFTQIFRNADKSSELKEA